MSQGVVPPHWTVQDELPVQASAQPPAGQTMWHSLLPVHVIIEPVPSVMSQLLRPPQVTDAFIPASRTQWLLPSQRAEHPVPQEPVQMDWPAHVLVQSAPQVRSHMFFESQ